MVYLNIREQKTEDTFQYGMNQLTKSLGGVMTEETKVSVTLGYTLNLGNFQSLRMDLGVTDSRRDGENVDQAFERVYKFVEDKLTEKVAEAKSEIKE
jgi:hypothetical protein